jgi:hypothetical protein
MVDIFSDLEKHRDVLQVIVSNIPFYFSFTGLAQTSKFFRNMVQKVHEKEAEEFKHLMDLYNEPRQNGLFRCLYFSSSVDWTSYKEDFVADKDGIILVNFYSDAMSPFLTLEDGTVIKPKSVMKSYFGEIMLEKDSVSPTMDPVWWPYDKDVILFHGFVRMEFYVEPFQKVCAKMFLLSPPKKEAIMEFYKDVFDDKIDSSIISMFNNPIPCLGENETEEFVKSRIDPEKIQKFHEIIKQTLQ